MIMNKIFKTFALAAMALGMSVMTFAQNQELPNDPAVIKGKLDNGMTYYIRKNDKPAGRAEFYLATNVGAIQETPDQDGLAHFLEHMCFNGTKNFPGKGILDYLQSIGASFGGNINASTGVEQTIYMLNNIPVSREGVVDSCILIMHDYSHFVTLDPKEIDLERPVIIEERRSRRNASWRMFEASLPYIYKDSKYATCTLIGSQENLENFKPASIENFYKTWYQPNNQALIIVGDIDVDKVIAKVKSTFSDIPAPESPKAKDVISIPDNKEPIIGIFTDPEATSTNVTMMWKREAEPESLNSTFVGELTSIIKNIISSVMEERFNDLKAQPNSPFINASLSIGNLCESLEVTYGSVDSKDGESLPAFKAFYTEVEKMRRFGFTDGEINRAKDAIKARYESRAKKAETRTNDQFVPELYQNFFDNDAYMEPAKESELVNQICTMLNAQVINQVIPQVVSDTNIVITYEAPKKEGLSHPTEADFLKTMEEVKASDIKANAEEVINEPLLDAAALKGSPVKKTSTTIYGATEWTLKNGLRVIALASDKEKDKIRFNLFKDGGMSLIETADLPSFEDNIFGLFCQNSGIAGFSATKLSKMLAGKNLSVHQYINGLHHGINGTSTKKDLETAMQLVYLTFTEPRFDQNEYEQGINQIKAVLPNLVNNPNYKLQEEFTKTLYNNSDRKLMISEDVLAKANLQTIEKNYRALFNNAAGATAIVVGDFDIDTLKTYCEKYLGSIPKGKKAEKWIDRNTDPVKGDIKNVFKTNMETPMCTVYQVYNAPASYTAANKVAFDALQYIMDMVYTKTLREEEGGTYGASTFCDLNKQPKELGMFYVVFQCKPSFGNKLRALAIDGIKGIATNGPTAEQFSMTVENLKKNIPEQRISNDYWMSSIYKYFVNGIDEDKLFEEAVNNLKPEDIKNAAKLFVESGNFIEVVMEPEKAAEAE